MFALQSAVRQALPIWTRGTLQINFALTKYQGSQLNVTSNYAKSGKPKNTSVANAQPSGTPFSTDECERLMSKAIEHLQHKLAGVRTGRAAPAMLDPVVVDTGHDRVPLKAVATVTARSPQQLAVTLFDDGMLDAVQKAIRTSPLELNPIRDGPLLLVNIARPSKEAVEKLVRLVHEEAETARVSVRHARQKGLEAARLEGGSKDATKRNEKEVQQLHDKFIGEVDRLREAKQRELKENR